MRIRHAQHCKNRHGYTLLELLLVLMVLLVVAAIAWPNIERRLFAHRLQSAAEQVRATLALTRLTAIETGKVCVFGYDPNGNQYMVTVEPGEAAATPSQPPSPDMMELPEGMRFAAIGTSNFDSVASSLSNTIPNPAAGGIPATWAAPIHFYPDGSAEDALWQLLDEDQQRVQLSVRGLTGTVSLGQVQAGELAP